MRVNLNEVIGKKFGSLTIIGLSDDQKIPVEVRDGEIKTDKLSAVRFTCRCECGELTDRAYSSLFYQGQRNNQKCIKCAKVGKPAKEKVLKECVVCGKMSYIYAKGMCRNCYGRYKYNGDKIVEHYSVLCAKKRAEKAERVNQELKERLGYPKHKWAQIKDLLDKKDLIYKSKLQEEIFNLYLNNPNETFASIASKYKLSRQRVHAMITKIIKNNLKGGSDMGYTPRHNLKLLEKPEHKDNMLSFYMKFFNKKELDISCLSELEQEIYILITEYGYSKSDLCKAYNTNNNVVMSILNSMVHKLQV